MTDLSARLNVQLPIVQAPMAGSQGVALASAVANAGGLGSLPCAMLSGDALRSAYAELSRATSGPINLNFFCHAAPAPAPQREAAWRASLEPYYREAGLSQSDLPAGPQRLP